jgi:hypothetical protein
MPRNLYASARRCKRAISNPSDSGGKVLQGATSLEQEPESGYTAGEAWRNQIFRLKKLSGHESRESCKQGR